MTGDLLRDDATAALQRLRALWDALHREGAMPTTAGTPRGHRARATAEAKDDLRLAIVCLERARERLRKSPPTERVLARRRHDDDD